MGIVVAGGDAGLHQNRAIIRRGNISVPYTEESKWNLSSAGCFWIGQLNIIIFSNGVIIVT